jgi:hypothetical protein
MTKKLAFGGKGLNIVWDSQRTPTWIPVKSVRPS